MKLLIKGFSIILFSSYFSTISLSFRSTQQQEEFQELKHEVTVTLKLIQVFVTDKKRNPVTGLKKEDFFIYDNGKAQAITEFEQHILSLPTNITGVQPEILQETESPAPHKVMSRKFFFIFDFAYNNARGILKAKKAALHFIDTQLQPSDEVGVLSYSSIKSLTLHENLTTNHKKVHEVVESFDLKEVHGRAENLESKYWAQMNNRNPLDHSEEGMKGLERAEGLKVKLDRIESLYQAENFARKLTDFGKAIRYIPGYKNIILFSSGTPSSMMYGQDLIGSEEARTRLAFENMLKELAASNSPVYTINTEELAEQLKTAEGMSIKLRGDFSLQSMASSTGGKYLGHIDTYQEHLETIQNLTSCYYVLGYYIEEKWDGKYHKIRVRVNQPNCDVHAQEGYFNPKPFTEYSKTEKMLHLIDLALTENPIFQTPLRFPLTALGCSIEGKPSAALFSKIPRDIIHEFSDNDVEIVSIILDEDDNIVKTERDMKNFSKLPDGNIYYYSLFFLDPAEYECRLVIRNLETGKGAVAAYPVVIFERQEQGMIELYSPLLLISERNAFYMKGTIPSKVSDTFSVMDYLNFDSSQYAPLIEEELKSGTILSAVLPYSVSGILEPEVMISISLIDLSFGELIPLKLASLSESKHMDLFLRFIEIQIPELSSGDYAMTFSIEETKSQSSSSLTKIFEVK